MDCPLTLYHTGTVGTTDYLSPCGCCKMCDFTSCRFSREGLVVTISCIGSTETNTVCLAGKACGGSFPLVAESTNAPVTNADITAGGTYKIYPVFIDGILRGVVEGL